MCLRSVCVCVYTKDIELAQARGFQTEVRNNEVTVYLVTPAEFAELKHRPVSVRAVISNLGRKTISFYQIGTRHHKLTRNEALDTIRNISI
jgi:hypothetical protein